MVVLVSLGPMTSTKTRMEPTSTPYTMRITTPWSVVPTTRTWSPSDIGTPFASRGALMTPSPPLALLHATRPDGEGGAGDRHGAVAQVAVHQYRAHVEREVLARLGRLFNTLGSFQHSESATFLVRLTL